MALKAIHEEMKERNPQNRAPRPRAGQALPGETRGALHMAQGVLGERGRIPNGPVLSLKSIFGHKYKDL